MRWRFAITITTLILIIAPGVSAGSPGPSEETARADSRIPTVGEFVTRYAGAMKLAAADTPEQALSALRAMGMVGPEPIDLGTPLTEGEVIRISRAMRLGLVSRSPEKPFSARQMETFFSVFGSELERGPGGATSSAAGLKPAPRGTDSVLPSPPASRPPNAADPRSKGKGKKKGLSPHFPF